MDIFKAATPGDNNRIIQLLNQGVDVKKGCC